MQVNEQANSISTQIALYLAENRELQATEIQTLLGFSSWAALQSGDEFAVASVEGLDDRPLADDDSRSNQSRGGNQARGNDPQYDGRNTNHSPREIQDSINNDYLISFENGKRYKTLKRHLTDIGMTPDQYREKHGLGEDYPMVAPSFSARRAVIARQMGLGGSRQGQNRGNQGRGNDQGQNRGRRPGGQPGNRNAAGNGGPNSRDGGR